MELTVRLTPTNITTALRAGDVILGDDTLTAPVKTVRLSHDGFENARIVWEDGQRDTLGLPSTVTVDRKPFDTLWTYRNHCGMWGASSDRPGFSAYEYAAGIVETIGNMLGGYADLFKIERYETDYETTGRNWVDVYTLVRSYGTAPKGFRSVDEINAS